MNKVYFNTVRLFLVAACLLVFGVSVRAASTVRPQWVQKGESFMNAKRTNDSYVFKIFHTSDADLNRVMEEEFQPLLDYVRDTWQAVPETMSLDSLVAEGVPSTFRVSFRDASGREGAVLARRVDTWLSFEDFASNEYEFEYYQLYAVSARDGVVDFDEFEPTAASKPVAAVLSVVPGLGQLYKGDTRKGLAIIGGEVAFGAAALIFQHCANRNQRHVDAGEFPVDSWESKVAGYKLVRNVSLGAMGAIWVFSIIDAGIAEALPKVLVRDSSAGQIDITPAPNSAGLRLVYNF